MTGVAQTVDSKFKNLVTAGCSFSTVADNSEYSLSWPEYLRDRLGIDNLYSLAQAGAGNRQIAASTQWFLEQHRLDCNDTLVVVMFSGNDRDDEIVDINCLERPSYRYTDKVAGAITGGQYHASVSNVRQAINFKEVVTKLKSPESRAVENYLHVIGLWSYLEHRGYQTVYTRFLDTKEPSRSKDFDIKDYLPEELAGRLDTVIDPKLTNIYSWCLRQGLLSNDDFHPAPEGYLSWVDTALIPYITNRFNYKP
jgi:lysophospholipase L1-like esterase